MALKGLMFTAEGLKYLTSDIVMKALLWGKG